MQRFALPGAAEVRHHEVHFGEEFGDVVQLERVDVFVPGDAARTALDAEVDQDGDAQFGAFLPDGKGNRVLDWLLVMGASSL